MDALMDRLAAQSAATYGSGLVVGDAALEAQGGDAGLASDAHPVGPTNRAGAETLYQPTPGDLDPAQREGLGRPQRHRIAFGESEEYRDDLPFDGEHGEIGHRMVIPRDSALPWEDSPATEYREVPRTDSANPAPSGCT